MYSKFKYVCGELIGQGFGAVVFSEAVDHSAMRPLFSEIKGAGFGHVGLTDVEVYGESYSLRVKSRPEDQPHVSRAVAHSNTIR